MSPNEVVDNMEQRIADVDCIRMPVGSIEFLKKNPEIAKMAGQVMVTILQCAEVIKASKELLRHPEFLYKHIQDGTPEELREFIEAAIRQQENGATFSKSGTLEQVTTELKETYGNDVLATDVSVNG